MAAGKKRLGVSFFFPRMILCIALILSGWPADAEEMQIPSPGQGKGADVSSRLQLPQNDPFRSPFDTGGSDAGAKKDCDTPAKATEKPHIAIIIDDMGNNRHIDEQLLDLNLNLTFAFLPYAPFTQELEERAWADGYDILVHMPMEAKDPQWNPGPDALYVNDSFEQITIAVEKNLALVPHATGVNNHMGSLFTEDRLAMHQFLGLIRQKGMFFIDSNTSSDSIGMKEAQEMGIRTARRQVFLDNIQDQKNICLQLDELVRIARKNGWAIGIGHSNETTLLALVQCRDTLLEYVNLVGIHELIQ